jgi:hypothetical protein
MLFLLRDRFNPETSNFEVLSLKGTQYEQENLKITPQNPQNP